jgi:hypothetical protein
MRGRVLGAELGVLVTALVFAEMSVVLLELHTDRILDWFVSLVPLIWIDVSSLFLYAFFRLYLSRSQAYAPTDTPWAGVRKILLPDLRTVRAQGGSFRRTWLVAGLVYALLYGFLQGIFVLDPAGSLQPGFVIIESAIGYGPGLVWAPTATFGIQLRPYSVAAAIVLSLLSGLVVALALQVLASNHRVGRALPGPLLGLAVMCPACAGGPVSGLFLAYVAPLAFMGGMGSASAFSRLLGFSTFLLIATLVLLWSVIAFLTNRLLAEGPARTSSAADSARP